MGKRTSLIVLSPRLRGVNLSLYARGEKLQMQRNQQLVAMMVGKYKKFCRLETFGWQAPSIEPYVKRGKSKSAETTKGGKEQGYSGKAPQTSIKQEGNWQEMNREHAGPRNVDNGYSSWREGRGNQLASIQEWNWPRRETDGNWRTSRWPNGCYNDWQNDEWKRTDGTGAMKSQEVVQNGVVTDAMGESARRRPFNPLRG